VSAARNPRRAYDEKGKEIPPATVAAVRELGMATVMAFCEAQNCYHDAVIRLDVWPEETAIPDLALQLRCSKCGSRKIRMMLNVTELYAKAHGIVPQGTVIPKG
jgi:hypothetical protein